jgi:hypothetical protein
MDFPAFPHGFSHFSLFATVVAFITGESLRAEIDMCNIALSVEEAAPKAEFFFDEALQCINHSQ